MFEINKIYNMDCLEGMRYIDDKSIDMNEEIIIKMYDEDKMTLRAIANIFNTNHHKIKYILLKNGIKITQKDRKRKPFTEEHRRKISEASKGRKSWSKGKKMPREIVLKNMIAHLKFRVDVDFYMEFDDLEKIKCLNRILTRDRVAKHFNTETYKLFIKKFYYDEQFNNVYNIWLSEKDKWSKPSLDHKIPLSRGGTFELNNLQILTWFENRAKCDMTQNEWEDFKKRTCTTSIYFV